MGMANKPQIALGILTGLIFVVGSILTINGVQGQEYGLGITGPDPVEVMVGLAVLALGVISLIATLAASAIRTSINHQTLYLAQITHSSGAGM